MTQDSGHGFKKSLGLIDSTSMVMGSMVGSGIFIVSADMARNLGSPGWLLLAWAITGVMTIIASLSFGELAGMMPQAGGIYVYLREAYSPLFGFLYGWTVFTVIQCGSIAAIAMAFSRFLGVIVPWVAEDNVIVHLGFFQLNSTKIIAIVMILFLSWINSRGIEGGKLIQNIFTFLKVAIIIVFILAGFIFIKSPIHLNWQDLQFWKASTIQNGTATPISGFTILAAMGVAMVGSLFASDAWYNITFAAGEVKNPKRTIPLSLFMGTFIVGILYFLVNVVYIKALPLLGDPHGANALAKGIQFASEDRVATAVMYQILGKSAEIVMALVVIISTFGCNNGMVISGPRLYYAMARDKVFFSAAGRLNKFRVPAVGLTLQAIWSTLLCLSGSYSDLLDYTICAVMIFNVLIITAIFVLRYKRPEIERPYRAVGYPILPLLYIAMSLFVLIAILIYIPKYTWPGFGLVVTGVPVFYLWRYFKPKGYDVPRDEE
jgi:basic amino acid/polyamine antiporter, APA family